MVWMVELDVTRLSGQGGNEGFVQGFYFHKSEDANKFYTLLLLATGYRGDKFIIRRPQGLDLSPADLDKLSTLDEIRRNCKHYNLQLRTGFAFEPDEVWAWCPDCNMLIKQLAVA